MSNATVSQDTLQLLKVIIRDAQDAIIVADAQGAIRCINAAGAQSLGLSVEGAIGAKLPDALRGTIAQLQRDGAARCEVEWPDGDTFQATLVPTPGPLMIFHHAARFRQRDWIELVAVVSHDLKAPLAVLGGYARVLEESPELAPHSREHARAIIENADRMRDLIESLLDLAQVEAGTGGQVKPCDLVALIGNAREMLERLAQEKQQALIFDLSLLPDVMGNPVRLTQVVCNLVGNAIKYTPPGGSVRVTAEQRDGQVCFCVQDNGPGIPPAAQPQLFQRFYRVGGAENGKEGTGLGLAIVKSIVESYGGRVWVSSQAGQGSAFGFALPMAGAAPSSQNS